MSNNQDSIIIDLTGIVEDETSTDITELTTMITQPNTIETNANNVSVDIDTVLSKEDNVEEENVEQNNKKKLEDIIKDNDSSEYPTVDANNIVFQKTEIFYNAYQTLETLVQGTKYNNSNWILLLTKTMTLVNEVKDLTKEDKVGLTVELVFHYLEENTDINPSVFKDIKSTIGGLIVSMLEINEVNKKIDKKTKAKKHVKQVKKQLSKDIDTVVSPLQITNTLINRIITIIKEKNLNIDNLKAEFPSLVVLSISLLDKYQHLTNNEKKNLVIQALTTVVNKHIIEEKLIEINTEEKLSIKFLIDELPVLIDTMVSVTNGKLNFSFDNPQTIFKCVANWFNIFKPFFSRCKK